MKERLGLLLILVVFVAASAYKFTRELPYYEVSCIEMVQIRKMMDYGFFARQGVVPDIMQSTGRLAHPEKFNYVHHPLPRNWPYALAYHFFGAVGAVVINLIAGLLECVFIYAALKRRFGFVPALVPAVLCACAPAMQYWAVETTSIIPMIVFWPLAALIIWPGAGRPWSPRARCWGLGLTVFVAGQVSWAILAIVPSLLLMSAIPGAGWKDLLRRNRDNPLWRAILAGAVLTALAFAVQVVLYTPHVLEPFEHVWNLLWTEPHDKKKEGISSVKLITVFFLRTVLLVSPALCLGALLGVWQAVRQKRLSLDALGMILVIALFFAGLLPMPNFYNNEKWILVWLIFPGAYLTASWLAMTRVRVAIWGLAALAIPGLLYTQAVAALPRSSRAAQTLTRYVVEHTHPEDLVLMDFKGQAFPVKYWDQYGLERLTDRLTYYDVNSARRADEVEATYRGEVARTLFLHVVPTQVDHELAQKLRDQGRLLDRSVLPIPAEVETGEVPMLRPIYKWRHMIGLGALGTANTNQTVTLELYQL